MSTRALRAGCSSQDAVLTVNAVTKTYAKHAALRGASVAVPAGQVHGLLGPNGSGKSTMLHVLTGLIPPDAGSVFIQDLRIEDKASRASLGFAPDDLPLPAVLTGLEYLDLHDALRSRRDHERARVLAHVLGIDGALGRQIAEYSHGMKRKIQLVAALMHQPKLLVLDEPFRGLDPDTASVLRELLVCFVGSERAVLVATHDMLRAERDCDVVTILDRGRVVVSGAPTELISDVPGAKSLEDVFLELTGRCHEVDRRSLLIEKLF